MKFVKSVLAFALAFAAVQCQASNKEAPPVGSEKAGATKSTTDVVCALAPSQSSVVKGISGTAGTAGVTTLALAQATGLSVVAHSSGGYILTGAGGYVAGTLGTAIVGPAIVGVGLLVGGAAVTVELLCAPRNHPSEVKKIEAASAEFFKRSKETIGKTPAALAKAKELAEKATIEVKRISGDVFDYAYRANKPKT